MNSEELKRIKIGDICVFIVCVIASIVLFTKGIQASLGDEVRILDASGEEKCYPLSKNQTIRIQNELGFNEIKIENGYVFVSDADCRGRQCFSHRPISKVGEVILCVPHKLCIEICAVNEYDSFTY